MTNENFTTSKIANLKIACHYWELAKKYTGTTSAQKYYAKAYAILQSVMGANAPIALELKREMSSPLMTRTY